MPIILRFIEGGKFIPSGIIEYATRCQWSHVEAIGAEGTFGAQLRGGVIWRRLHDNAYRGAKNVEICTLDCTGPQANLFWNFLLDQLNKPYDWRAIVGFGFGRRDWREDDSWFCSELQVRALEVAGLLKLPADIPMWRITPRDLWLLVQLGVR